MSSISPLILTYLLTGLTVGFGHCIGMCGPLAISLSLSRTNGGFFLSHLLYQCGRTITYTALGAVIGATGSFAVMAGRISMLQKGILFFAGGLIVAMGLAMGGWLPRFSIFHADASVAGAFARAFKRLSHARSTIAHFPTGLLLGLLPCGPVYTALLGAARAGMEAGNAYHGAAVGAMMMAAFGVGTIPALFLVAKLADMGWLRFREKIYKVGAVLMIGVGIYFLYTAVTY